MECVNCRYRTQIDPYHMCDITHTILDCKLGKQITACSLESDEDVPLMKICFNCTNWIGGGDFGLSCKDDYYNTSTNGFDEVCERFKRKYI